MWPCSHTLPDKVHVVNDKGEVHQIDLKYPAS
jgi:hypothetical protein